MWNTKLMISMTRVSYNILIWVAIGYKSVYNNKAEMC